MKYLLLFIFCLPLTGCDLYRRLTGREPQPEDATYTQPEEIKGEAPISILPISILGSLDLVIGGQSNAVGSDGEIVASLTGRVEVTNMVTGEQFIPTVTQPAIHSIPWVYLGDQLVNQTGKDVKVYNRAVGSTSTQDWIEDKGGNMTRLLQTVRDVQPEFVLWVGHESDCLFNIKNSYANFKSMLEQVKQASPNSQIVIAITGCADGGEQSDIVQVQYQLINEGYAVKGSNLQAMRREPGYADHFGWGYHLSDMGKKRMAQEFFEAIGRFI